jgi:hypothetical protein
LTASLLLWRRRKIINVDCGLIFSWLPSGWT